MLNVKEKLLAEILTQVPWHGWSNRAIKNASRNLELDYSYHYILFPSGVEEVLEYYLDQVIKNIINEVKTIDLTKFNTKDKIIRICEVFFKQNHLNKLAIDRALSYYLIPGRNILGLKNYYRLINQIWYLAGDKSTDFSFYTKRASFGLIMLKTITFWTKSKSNETEAIKYMNKQIKILNLINFKKLKGKIFNVNNIPFIRLINR